MRTVLDQQLDALTTIIAGLCAMTGGVVPAGYQAPLPRDMALAEGAADECDKIAHTVVSSPASVADSCHMGDLAQVSYMKEHSVSRLMSVSVRSGLAKAAVAGVLVAMPMVGVTVAAYAAPGNGTSRTPAPPESPSGPNDPSRTRAPRAPTVSPSESNAIAIPTGPNDPKCTHYPECEGGSIGGPHHRGAPADPGGGQVPRTPTSTTPTRTSSRPAPPNPDM